MIPAAPESSLIFVAIAMCSILVLFSLASAFIFRCCKVLDIQQIPATVYERTRASIMWARDSIFTPTREEEQSQLHATHREFQKIPQSPV